MVGLEPGWGGWFWKGTGLSFVMVCFLILACISFPSPAFSGLDEEAVQRTVDNFLIAMLAYDEMLFESTLPSEGTVAISAEGEEYAFDLEEVKHEFFFRPESNVIEDRTISLEDKTAVVSGTWIFGLQFWDEYETTRVNSTFHLQELDGAWYIQAIELGEIETRVEEPPAYPGILVTHDNQYFSLQYPPAWDVAEEETEPTRISPHVLWTRFVPPAGEFYLELFVYERDFDSLAAMVDGEVELYGELHTDLEVLEREELVNGGQQAVLLFMDYIDFLDDPQQELIFYIANERYLVEGRKKLDAETGVDTARARVEAMLEQIRLK